MDVLENNPDIRKELGRRMKESDDDEHILLSEMMAIEKKTRLLKQKQVREGWKMKYETSRRMEMITNYLRNLQINLEDMELSEHNELDDLIKKLKISTANNKVINIKDEEMELDKIYDMIIDGQNEGAVVKNQSMNNDCVSEDCSDVDEVMDFESWVESEISTMGMAMEVEEQAEQHEDVGKGGVGVQDEDAVTLMMPASSEDSQPAKEWKVRRRRGIIPDGLVQEKLKFFKLKFPNLLGGNILTNEMESVPVGSANDSRDRIIGVGVKRKAEPVFKPRKRTK